MRSLCGDDLAPPAAVAQRRHHLCGIRCAVRGGRRDGRAYVAHLAQLAHTVSPAVSPDGATVAPCMSGITCMSCTRWNSGRCHGQRVVVLRGRRGGAVGACGPDGSTVYVGSTTNAATGEGVWRFETGDWVQSSPALSADGATVYVRSNDGSLCAVTATTGEQAPQQRTPAVVIVSTTQPSPIHPAALAALSCHPPFIW